MVGGLVLLVKRAWVWVLLLLWGEVGLCLWPVKNQHLYLVVWNCQAANRCLTRSDYIWLLNGKMKKEEVWIDVMPLSPSNWFFKHRKVRAPLETIKKQRLFVDMCISLEWPFVTQTMRCIIQSLLANYILCFKILFNHEWLSVQVWQHHNPLGGISSVCFCNSIHTTHDGNS